MMKKHWEEDGFNLKYHGELPKRKSVEIKNSPIGVGFETLDRFMFYPEPCYPRLAELGAKWARCQTGWSRCEKEKGIYDFTWLDDVVDNLLKVGVQPWFCVCFGNKLYMPDVPHESAVGRVPIYYGEEVLKAWQNYCKALAKHFKGRVSCWEIWNEPNHGGGFWAPGKPHGADYAKLVEVSSKPIKEVLPDATIIAGAAGAGETFGFLKDGLDAGLGNYIDKWAIHPYRFAPEQNYSTEIKALRALLKRYNPAIKIWQGECGCASVEWGHNDAYNYQNLDKINEESQAKWLLRRIISDLREDIEFTSYFHTADLTKSPYVLSNGKGGKPNMKGLLEGDNYTPKKSYYALQNLCSLFDSETRREDIFVRIRPSEWPGGGSDSDDIFVNAMVTSFVRKGYPLFVYYLPSNPQEEFQAESIMLMFWNMAEKAIKNPVLINPLNGEIYKIPDFKSMEGWWENMFPANLPITNYPLIITDLNAI